VNFAQFLPLVGPETTQILIFLKPVSPEPPESTPVYALAVARILPGPPPRARVPRPDDPTPRKPPPVPFEFAGKSKVKPQGLGDLKRVSSGSLADLGKDVRSGRTDTDVFRVPPLPLHKDKGKGKGTSSKGDVFGGGIALDTTSSSDSSKGKRKRVEEVDVDMTGTTEEAETLLERENKNVRPLAFFLRRILIPLSANQACRRPRAF